jgi:hypothetical protein
MIRKISGGRTGCGTPTINNGSTYTNGLAESLSAGTALMYGYFFDIIPADDNRPAKFPRYRLRPCLEAHKLARYVR